MWGLSNEKGFSEDFDAPYRPLAVPVAFDKFDDDVYPAL